MAFAHRLSTYPDDAFKPVVYCTCCGQEKDLAGPCPGEYQLSARETAYIDREFEKNMKKIFNCT